jgi:hypothetical protein
MPFTLAHPAAVLPFYRSRIPFSALVIGSMIPDFEYFARFGYGDTFSHTLPGLFLFCLPAGLAVLWVFHRFLKQLLFALLPDGHRSRLAKYMDRFPFLPLNCLALLILGVLLGAAPHVAWDTFTHSYGWAVVHLPALDTTLLETGWGKLKIFKILQHLSTLVGLVLIAGAYGYWYRRAAPIMDRTYPVFPETGRRNLLAAMAGTVAVACISYAALRLEAPQSFGGFRYFVAQICLTAIVCSILVIIVYAAWWHGWIGKGRARKRRNKDE